MYRDIIAGNSQARIQAMIPTSLLGEQRLILMQFSDKIILNMVPFSAAEMAVKNVTAMLSVSSPSQGPSSFALKREYVIMVI